MRYIALLRCINVGKSGRVSMEKLRGAFESFGLKHVASYIQSGNIFFDAGARGPNLDQLESHIEQAIGFRSPIAVRTVEALQRAVEHSPFVAKTPGAEERFMILLPTRKLSGAVTVPSASAKGDAKIVAASGSEFFAVMSLVNGRPGNPVALVERTAGVPITARFFHTMLEIIKAAQR